MNRRRCVNLVIVISLAALISSLGVANGRAQTFDVAAKSVFMMDVQTGQVLFQKNADELLPPASLVKIMTLLVVMDAVEAGKVSLTDEVRTSRRASGIGGSQVYLAEGEIHTLEEMLKAVAIASGNDASVAAAEFLAGTEAAFTGMMNARARDLGMGNSTFTSPDGLPPEEDEAPSITTAHDIALAAQALIREHPKVLEWTSAAMEKFRDDPLFILYNTNHLVGKYDGLDGLKTGHTQAAGWCLVATAKRGETRLVSVVMGADSTTAREEQTASLLDHGFNRFVSVLVGEGTVGEIRVPTGSPERFDVAVAEPVRILKPRGEDMNVAAAIQRAPNLEAPIAKGEPVGEYVVRLGDQEVTRVPVQATTDVERVNIFVRLWRTAREFILGLFGRSS